jgi:3-hydroxyacyl-[acyl-carrier-protein] dehydratase
MLVEGFYEVLNLKQSEDSVQAEIRLNPDHHVYDGHFPEQPVVPGVLQLQIVKEVLESALQKNLRLNEMGFAKYLNLIVPEQHSTLTCSIKYQSSEEVLKINAVIQKDDLVFTKISASFGQNQ